MSTTIDQKVVEMRFDNAHFERNVSTSMSTLGKLKQALRLDGATKGLNEVGNAAKRVDFSRAEFAATKAGLNIQDIWLKVASTFEQQVANKIVNAATNMWNQLMVAPISDGFSEYEMTLNAVQTTMSATGKTAAEVETELKKLDEYADKTVYSTADMLNNLPKFTNAGVALEDATTAMIGIANATALAGGDASKASIAFYNLGQAISTGYLTRMDYNSINNAGIATMEWKNQMVKAAIAAGTLTEAGENMYVANGKTFTLQQLFIDGLQEQWASTEVMMEVFKAYGDETTKIGEKAYSSAQDIKTFTMMMDSLKATAGTGWKDTWQIIFGDLEEAKVFWTSLTNGISGLITGFADWRNELLGKALGNPFESITSAMDKLIKPVEEVTEKLEDLETIANRVIRGDFGNGLERVQKLTEAGYNYAKVQNLVNEKLGSSFRYLVEEEEAQENATEARVDSIESILKLSDAELKAAGCTKEEIEALRALAEYAEKTGIPVEELTKDLDQLSGRNLLINSFKNIATVLGQTASTVKDAWQDIFPPKSMEERAKSIYNIIAAFHKFTRSLTLVDAETGKLNETGDKLMRTFKGVFAAIDIILTVVGGPIKWAFSTLIDILGMFDLNILDLTANLGDVIVGFRDWLKENNFIIKALDKLKPHIANVIDMFSTWINGIDFSSWFGRFKDDVNGAAKSIVEWWKGLKDADDVPKYIFEGITNAFNNITKNCGYVGRIIRDSLLNALREIPGASKWVDKLADVFAKAGNYLSKAKSAILEWLTGLQNADNVTEYLVDSLVSGVKNGIPLVVEVIKYLGKAIYRELMEIPGFKAFSDRWLDSIIELFSGIKDWFAGLTTAEDVEQYLVDSFVTAVKQGIPVVVSVVKKLCKAVYNELTDIPEVSAWIDKWFGGIIKIVSGISNWLVGLKDTENIGKYIIQGLVNGLKNGSDLVLDTIIGLAKNLIELVCNVLGIHSPSTVFWAIGAFIIAGLIGGLTEGASGVYSRFLTMCETIWGIVYNFGLKIVEFIKGLDIGQVIVAGIGIGLIAAVLTIAKAAKNITDGIGGFGELLESAADAMTRVSKAAKNFLNAHALLAFALAIVALAGAVALLAKVEPDRLWGAIGAIAALSVLMGALAFVVSLISEIEKFDAKTILSVVGIVAALAVIASIICKLAGVNVWDGVKALIGVTLALGVLVGALKLISLFIKDGAAFDSIGSMLLKMAVAMLIMVGVVKLAGMIRIAEIKRAAGTIIMVGTMFAGLVAVSRFAGQHAKEAGKMLTKMSVAMLIMVGVVKLAAGISPSEAVRGIAVITAIGALFAALIAVSSLLTTTFEFGEDGSKKSTVKGAKQVGQMLLNLALAFAIIVGTIKMISGMDNGDIARGLSVITGISVILGAMIWVSKFAGKHAASAGKMLLGMAGVLTVMVGLMFLIGLMDPKKMAKGLIALTLLTSCVAGIVYITKYAKITKSTAKTLTSLAIVMGILTALMITLTFIDPKKVATATGAMVAMMASLSLVLYFLKSLQGVDATSAMKTLITLGVVIALLGGIVALLSLCDPTSVVTAAASLSVMMLALAVMTKALGSTEIPGKGQFGNLIKTMAVLVGAMAALGLVLVMMSALKVDKALTNAAALSILLVVISGIAVLLGKFGKNAGGIAKASLTLFILVGVMATLGLVLAMMTALNVQNALTNAMALSAMLIVLAGVAAVLSIFGFFAADIALGSACLFILVGVMATLGLVLAMMDALGVKNGKENAIILCNMLVVLTGVAVAMSIFGALAPLMALGITAMSKLILIMATLGLVLKLMEVLKLANAKENSEILINLIESLADICVKLAIVGPLALVGVSALAALEALMVATALLAVAIGALSNHWPAFNEALDTGIPLLIKLAGAMGEMVAAFIEAIAKGLGDSLVTIADSLSEFADKIQPFLDTIGKVNSDVLAGAGYLTGAILALTAANFITGVLTLGPKILSFVDLGLGLSAFMAAAKGFIDGCANVDANTIECAKNLAGAILALAAADFISGVLSIGSVIGNFVELGLGLSAFMLGAHGFIEGCSSIDANVVACAENLADVIIALSGAGILDGLGRLVNFGLSSLETFAIDLPLLGLGIAGFAKALKDSGITTTDLDMAHTAADAIGKIAGAEMPNSGGLISLIVGDNTLATFGKHLKDFATPFCEFIDALRTAGLTKADIALAETAANSLAAMAAVELPNTGGFISWIVGNNDLGVYGANLSAFADGFCAFVTKLRGASITEDDISLTKLAASAVSELSSIKIENEGGLWGLIAGEGTLKSLGSNLESLGTSLSTFITTLKTAGIDETSITTIKTVASALDEVAALGSRFEESLWEKWTGTGPSAALAALSEHLPALGDAVAKFCARAGSYGADAYENLKVLKWAIDMVSGIGIDADMAANARSLQNLGATFESLGESLKKFADSLGKNSAVEDAIDSIANDIIPGLKSVLSELGKMNFGNVDTFSAKISQLGEGLAKSLTSSIHTVPNAQSVSDAIKGLVDQACTFASGYVTGTSGSKPLYDVGVGLATNISDGFGEDTSYEGKIDSLISLMKARLESPDKSTLMWSAGNYLAQGFANGINGASSRSAVSSAATSLASLAINTVKEALGVQSPSRVFYEIGGYTIEGFVNALYDYAGSVANASAEVANSATNGFSKAISDTIDMFSLEDIDQPTIRPIIDLTDVETGVNAISSMFGNSQLLGVSANVDSVASLMRNRQNGTNDDVVTAIDKLNKKLDSVRGNTYTISGINYTEGDDVALALETIVRAARIERRA